MMKASLYAIVSLLVATTSVMAQHNLSVEGRVVDAKGLPVEGAVVSMTDYKAPKNSFDWLILGDTTDKDGRFRITTYTNNTLIKTYLFVSYTASKLDAIVPISAPFGILQSKRKLKATQAILRKNVDSNVGNIPILVWLNTVEVRFLSKESQPLFRSFEESSRLIFAIRDEKGKLAAAQSLSIDDRRKRLNYDKGSILMDLPEGTWTVELLSEWSDLDNRRTLGKSKPFEVVRSSGVVTVEVVATK